MFGLAVATTSDPAVAASLGAEAFPSVALFDRGNAARWFHFQNSPPQKKFFLKNYSASFDSQVVRVPSDAGRRGRGRGSEGVGQGKVRMSLFLFPKNPKYMGIHTMYVCLLGKLLFFVGWRQRTEWCSRPLSPQTSKAGRMTSKTSVTDFSSRKKIVLIIFHLSYRLC